MNGISALKKEPWESLFSLTAQAWSKGHMRAQQGSSWPSTSQEEKSHQELILPDFDLGPPASGTRRKQISVYLNHPIYDILL